MKFDDVKQKVSFPQMEEEILQFWNDEKIFQKSIDKRDEDNSYIFYDGPPFATGDPHYGHLLTSYVKDLVPRYQTMKGKRVERRWGWDCHGLPIENLVQKKINASTKDDIEKFGVYDFSEECRNSVFGFADVWEEKITRIGRWVDFNKQYRTMDFSYMESVWWAFKDLYDKGLIYEGYKVLPYCIDCSTPLSNFETKLDDAYRMKQDPAATVKLKLNDTGEFILIWTTTPWTLPSNLACAVGPDLDYVRIKDLKNNEVYILASERLPTYYKDESDYELLSNIKGKELDGMSYEPLFDYYKGDDAFKVILADYVTVTDGTGIVHQAPAFGEDDFYACKANNIGFFMPIDDSGKYTEEAPDLLGVKVFDANKIIIKNLKDSNQLIHQQTIDHSYPHCWRCDNPLIYKGVNAWFLAVEKIKADIIANNENVNWVPERIKHGSFGKWLENARDWCISRNRYWGSVLPVWKCTDCNNVEVMGSSSDLKEKTGREVTDLHKHIVDDYTYNCSDCKGTMVRIPEILDCWFESGSMPFAQDHYPFKNKEQFDKNFPADFIVEYIGQTRAWFYNLMVLSTGLFNKHTFNNVVTHGVLLAEDGRKMSKRLKNYPDPMYIVNKYGADSLRLSLIVSPNIRGEDVCFSESMVDEAMKKVLLPYWNAYFFFTAYAKIDNFVPTGNLESSNILDKWILTELNNLVKDVTENLDKYDLMSAGTAIYAFLDSLNNWYIRRSRKRFWKSENDIDKNAAYEVLYYVLVTFTKVVAPYVPFTAEHIFKNLTKQESVHLEDYPEFNSSQCDDVLRSEISSIRNIINLGHSLRARMKIKVRQPLSKLEVYLPVSSDLLTRYGSIICEELNVEEVHLLKSIDEKAELTVVPDSKVLGPRFGKDYKDLLIAIKSGKFEILDNDSVKVGEHLLSKEEVRVVYKAEEDNVASDKGVVVLLDGNITDDLKEKGIVRDFVRFVQSSRKYQDLAISDRIVVEIKCNYIIKNILLNYNDSISSEVLADKIEFLEEGEFNNNSQLDDENIEYNIKLTNG